MYVFTSSHHKDEDIERVYRYITITSHSIDARIPHTTYMSFTACKEGPKSFILSRAVMAFLQAP